MTIEKISEILEEFAREFTAGNLDREFFTDFVIYNDLGIPLAQTVVYGLSKPTEKGEAIILETWNNLCFQLGSNPEFEYDDLDDLFGDFEEDE